MDQKSSSGKNSRILGLSYLSYLTKLYVNKTNKNSRRKQESGASLKAPLGPPQKAPSTPFSEPPAQSTKPTCPCRLFLPVSRLGHWEMKLPGALLSAVTYLDVTCLMRSGVPLMGMDRQEGRLRVARGRGAHRTGLPESWGKVYPGERQVLKPASESCLEQASGTLVYAHKTVSTF